MRLHGICRQLAATNTMKPHDFGRSIFELHEKQSDPGRRNFGVGERLATAASKIKIGDSFGTEHGEGLACVALGRHVD